MKVRRLVVAACFGVAASLAATSPALGHPLGNYTVNRAVAVSLTREAVSVRYLVDMAEIPAFATLQVIDADADNATDANEERSWAVATCARARAALTLTVDGRTLDLADDGEPTLSYPPGAGGLETLRLECPLAASLWLGVGEHQLTVDDSTDDGHVGWREVTIAASGLALESEVPALSPSRELTAYPPESLSAPPDVRAASATIRVEPEAGDAPAPGAAPASGAEVSEPRITSTDPFAALIAGELTLPVALLAFAIAAGLGAAHALSPGHGKTLVAAYVIGSGGTLRQAAGLGIAVASTHTLGVFALGAATLVAGELIIPERVIAWLSVASGGLISILGVALVWRAYRSAGVRGRHGPGPGHAHPHPHPHPHPRSLGETSRAPVSVRGLVALGLAGGMVPSASALIVLLAAVSTGRLLFGIGLIVAFGVGMAAVLAGLAAATTVARRSLRAPKSLASAPLVRRAAALLPLASGACVLVIGGAVTIAALGQIG